MHGRAGRRGARWVAVLLCLAAAGPGSTRGSRVLAAEDRPAHELTAAGSETILWFAIGQWDEEQREFLQSLAYMDKSSERILPATRVPPQIGSITRRAVAGENLHVFYGPGSSNAAAVHMRYTRGGEVRETRLPGHVLPAAIAGTMEDQRPVLWAVVAGPTAHDVAVQWEREAARRHPETTAAPEVPDPAQINAGAELRAADPPESDGSYHLIRYEAGFWRPGFPAPAASAASRRVWLCVFGREQHFFWQRNSNEAEIEHAWHDGEQWHEGGTIRLSSPPEEILVTEINRQVVLAAFIAADADEPRWLCESAIWHASSNDAEAGQSSQPVQLRDQEGGVNTVPAGASLGAFGDSVVLFWMGQEHPEVGFWSPSGGRPTRPAQSVRLPRPGARDRPSTGVREFATTLIVVALLLLVFWRRHERIALPVELPEGVRIAGTGKRALAALLDAAPALAIALMVWHDPVLPYLRALWSGIHAGRSDELELLETPLELAWAWWTFRVIYVGYCWILEALRGTTPGKQLLGCRVIAESLEQPNPVQIGIRNVSRLLELEPMLQIWPFLLVVFFTRNRQRIGDLLARTIVVEGAAALPPETEDARENGETEAEDEAKADAGDADRARNEE